MAALKTTTLYNLFKYNRMTINLYAINKSKFQKNNMVNS